MGGKFFPRHLRLGHQRVCLFADLPGELPQFLAFRKKLRLLLGTGAVGKVESLLPRRDLRLDNLIEERIGNGVHQSHRLLRIAAADTQHHQFRAARKVDEQPPPEAKPPDREPSERMPV